ncbi:MAG TPA: EGF domain-containing protein [Kofleriaceae bacterium]
MRLRGVAIAAALCACDAPEDMLGELSQSETTVAPHASVYNFDTDIDHGRVIARDGDVLVVGAPKDDFDTRMRSGVAYVRYRNSGGTDAWGVIKELHANDAAAYDCFGRAVAIAGDIIAVGAKCANTSTGAVYVFLRDQGGMDNWGQAAKLTAADGLTYNRYGRALAITGDVVAVGAPVHDERTVCFGASCPPRHGAVYLYGRNVGGTNMFGAMRKAQASDSNPNASYGDQFGIALAAVGDMIAVGSQAQTTFRGAVYLLERNAGGADNWGETKKLVSGLTTSHCFGATVALTATHVAAGAPCEAFNGTASGAAYVFGRDQGGAGMWGLVKKVTGTGVDLNDQYGDDIELAADTLVVGAITGGTAAAGTVYVFDRALGGADNWGEVKRVELGGASTADDLGAAIAGDGNVVLVAAPGRDDAWRNAGGVYRFARDEGGTNNWGVVGTGIAPPTAVSFAPSSFARFGSSVAADNDLLVVGAYADRFVASNAGAALVYRRNEGGTDAWGGIAKLTPPAVADQHVGWSVAISGTTIVVGGYLVGGGVGGAFVYEPDAAGRWQRVKQLSPSDNIANGWFGISVDIHGDTIVVGAPGRSTASVAGAAYVYERDLGGANNWGERKKLVTSDAAVNDEVGRGVAIDGDTIVVGAAGDDHGTFSNPGSAYVFDRDAGGTDNWGEVKKLVAFDAANTQSYGGDVDIEGDIVVIGHKDSGFTGPERMQTYLYGRNVGGGGAWGMIRKLEDADTLPADAAGNDVAIAGPLVVVGAYRASNVTGAIYVFAKDQGGPDNWGLISKQVSTDGGVGDAFGKSVAAFSDLVFAGAPDKSYMTASNAGKAYVFRVTDPCLPNPCVNGGSCSVVNSGPSCTCQTGYTGATCADDVDECSAGAHTCSADATCTNAAPGFSCACNAGFTGDGMECTAIDPDDPPPGMADGGCCNSRTRPEGTFLLVALVVLLARRRRANAIA